MLLLLWFFALNQPPGICNTEKEILFVLDFYVVSVIVRGSERDIHLICILMFISVLISLLLCLCKIVNGNYEGEYDNSK